MAEALVFDGVVAGYGDAVVLDHLGFALAAGQSLAVLGRNGVGKSTLLETLMGNTRVRSGRMVWQGRDITRMPSYQRARLGLGWVPQEREVFASLTVEENLEVVARRGEWTRDRVYRMFPRLGERRQHLGSQLSGGEQQMLAIGRALMTNPRLLLLDEPTEGLAPVVAQEVGLAIRQLCEREAIACLLVEQHPEFALELTQQAVVLQRGRIVHCGPSAELAARADLRDALLGVGGTPRREAAGA